MQPKDMQEYLPAAETSVFSVSGFYSSAGELVARGAMKVLQRPRPSIEIRTPASMRTSVKRGLVNWLP